MQYLTYDEYKEIGGVCDLAAFNRYIVRACGIIDNETHNRLENMLEVPEQVKYCLRDLVEYMTTNMPTDAAVASRSQSVGGVSESENYNIKGHEELAAEIINLIYDYLLNVKDKHGYSLLYRG